MSKVFLVGITHIDNESQIKVSRVLDELQPDAVCLEIDSHRLQLLLENENVDKKFLENLKNEKAEVEKTIQDSEITNSEPKNDAFEMGEFSSILDDIGFFEQQLAKISNTKVPGKEMLIAYTKAVDLGAKVYLIDQSIHEISDIMEKEVSIEEAHKFQEMVDELVLERKIVSKPFENNINEKTSEHQERLEEIEDEDEINLNEIFEIFKNQNALGNILSVFQNNFPKLFSILLEDRNVYMAKRIVEIASSHKKIAVILGYGHVEDVKSILLKMNKKIDVEVVD